LWAAAEIKEKEKGGRRRGGGPRGKMGQAGPRKSLGRGKKKKERRERRGGLIFIFFFFFFNPFKTKLSNLLLIKPFQVSKIILKTLNHTTKN
jgi:hypothetical protein